MEQKIAFDPALGLTAAQMAAAWNANPTTAAHGPAHIEAAPPGQFMDFAEMGFMVISGMAINFLSSYLYDLVKDAFAGKPAPTVAVHELPQPDGSKIVIIVKS